MVAGIVAVVVVGLIAVNLLGHPSTKNLDVEELAQEYFENNGSRNFVVDATFLYLVASTLNGIQNAFKWNTVISDFW